MGSWSDATGRRRRVMEGAVEDLELAVEEEEEGLPPVEAPVEARVEAPEISLIDACKTVPAEVVVRKMPRSAAPGGLTV